MKDPYAIDSTKLQYHLDKLYHWKHVSDKTTLTPIYVEISPVGNCNHRCTFCAMDFMGYKNTCLSRERLSSLVYQFKAAGVKSVMLAGEGEPLLHPSLPSVIEDCGKAGLACAITTNGVGLTEKYYPVLEHVDWIKLSVNGGNSDVYSTVHHCKRSDWDKLWHNLFNAVTFTTLNHHKTVFGVQCVVLPENLDTLHDLARLAKFYGASYLVLKPYSQHSKSMNVKTLNYLKEEYAVLENLAGEYMNDQRFSVIARTTQMYSVSRNRLRYPTCLAVPYFWAYITSTGDVYGCSAFLGDDRFKYGNVNEQEFIDIWLGDKRKKAMEFMKTFSTENCRKGCRMNCVNEYLWKLKEGCLHEEFI